MVFQPSGRKGEVSGGKTVIEASRELGIEIESLCGGVRNCGKCKIKLVEGHLSPFTDEEAKFITELERTEGYRLSCAAQIKGDVLIYVPEESRPEGQVVRKEATERPFELKPAVTLYFIELSPPSLQDPLGDFDRLKKAFSEKYQLHDLEIDYQTLLKVPRVLREGNWKVTVVVWMEEEIIDIKPGRVDEIYGLAVDIGTTTVAGYLCSLRSGKVIATESMMNPQVTYGEDVMSRITYAMTHPEEGLEKLHRSVDQWVESFDQNDHEKMPSLSRGYFRIDLCRKHGDASPLSQNQSRISWSCSLPSCYPPIGRCEGEGSWIKGQPICKCSPSAYRGRICGSR